MTTLTHTWYQTLRQLRSFIRQPWYVAFTLIQPMIYLLLFGALFQRVSDIPGFEGTYIAFLTPGIVIMSAVFAGGWAGMGIIEDLDKGVIDRFLVTPASRFSLLAGRFISLSVVTVIQSLIIIAVGLPVGATYPGGLSGVAVMIVASVLLAVPFGALSCGLALIVRKEESVIGAANFVTLPLTFLGSVFMASSLLPGWMQTAAAYNPVNWAVEAARGALATNADWPLVLTRAAFLVVFSMVASWLATRAFSSYQRSI